MCLEIKCIFIMIFSSKIPLKSNVHVFMTFSHTNTIQWSLNAQCHATHTHTRTYNFESESRDPRVYYIVCQCEMVR